MDQIDGKWEQFSDRFGLGAERSKQAARPTPKVIPDPLPLDVTMAKAILEIIDAVYLNLMTPSRIKPNSLQEQIDSLNGETICLKERTFSKDESYKVVMWYY